MGKKSKLIDITLEDPEIDGADVEVTQGVSQVTGTVIVPLAEDMLQSRMMTIEDLIESSDQCVVIVLASIIGIEAEYSWYYDACTKCAGRIKIIAGKMFCSRCKQSRNAVPRFKLHVQVMDNTGSTSFILFDRNVSNYVGKSVQDLIDAQGQGNNDKGYPSDLEVLVGKKMLFKVEVTEGNLHHSWRNYGVKRTSDDSDLISPFVKRHNLKITFDEDEDCGDDVALTQAAVVSENVKMIEGGDSSNTVLDQKESEKTPCSKSGEKRSADADVSAELGIDGLGETSINKPHRLKSVKIEKTA